MGGGYFPGGQHIFLSPSLEIYVNLSIKYPTPDDKSVSHPQPNITTRVVVMKMRIEVGYGVGGIFG